MRAIECFVDPVCPWCWVVSGWIRTVRDETGLVVRWRFLSLALLDEAAPRPRPGPVAAIHARGREHLALLAAVRRLDGDEAVDRLLHAIGEEIWSASPGGVGWRDHDDRDVMLDWAARPLDAARLLASVGVDPTIADEVDAVDRATVARDTATAVRRVGRGLGTPVITLAPPDGPSFFGPVVATSPTDPDDAVRVWRALETLASQRGFAELRTNHRPHLDVPLMRAIGRAHGTGPATAVHGHDHPDRQA